MKQPTAVIVEDELQFAQALTAFIEDLGYQVLATADTEQGAIEAVRELQPDVVLMDVQLMDGNGVGAAIMIRESSDVPIVFCSSYAANAVVRSTVHAVRNAALIGKPFDEAELVALLANAVKNEHREAVAL